jgi:hypothetical protein
LGTHLALPFTLISDHNSQLKQKDREIEKSEKRKGKERKEKSCSSSTSFTFMPLFAIIN